MSQTRVGVLRGGPSSEYEVSLETGRSVLEHLPEPYRGVDIFIDREGHWHYAGLPTTPARAARQVDVFFNALHGEYGEDGRLQNLLDQLGAPYTGSGVFASAVGMNKALAKEVFRRQGIKTPLGLSFWRDEAETAAEIIFAKLPPPWVVKPLDRGSSVGLTLARSYPALAAALVAAWEISPRVLVEEYIRGREATCGVLDDFRGREHYALPPIEIRRPDGKAVWDYTDKYSGATEEICPAVGLTSEEKAAVEQAAVAAHRALGLRHYSRADFILGRRGIYLLEVNTLPGLTPTSLLPKSLAAVGVSYPQFLAHLVNLARDGRA